MTPDRDDPIIRYMSNIKTNVDAAAAMFKALSNPQRLRMFLRLATPCCAGGATRESTSSCCAGELGSALALAPSTVSHHLKELRQAGLMRVERKGQRINCWVSEDAVARLLTCFDGCCGPGRTQTVATPRRRKPEGAKKR